MRIWYFLLRLWKINKLHFISLVLVAGLIVPMVISAVDDYPHSGWRSVLLPVAMSYALFRLVQIAQRILDRGIVGGDENAPFDKRLAKAFRKGLIGSGQYDELIREQFAKDEAYRLRLWGEAASNPQAARKLQRALQQELEAVDDIIRYNADHRPEDKEGLQDLRLVRKEKVQDLERAAALIRQLHE